MGNLLGDFVKGKRYLDFEPDIREGILLHRAIDAYTDRHPEVLGALEVLRAEMPLSAGVFTDILFDHFLANDRAHFTPETLSHFSASVYQTLQGHQELFDERMQLFFGYMKEYNWLFHYHSAEGLERVLRGMCRRYPRLGEADRVVPVLMERLPDIQPHYEAFFPDLLEYVRQWIAEYHTAPPYL